MKAIILLSGGIDSAVILGLALEKQYTCHALSFDYGQRHLIELDHAKIIAKHYHIPHTIINIDPNAFSGSSLVNDGDVPKGRTAEEMRRDAIPNTYVPGRNTLFLAYALSQAEILEANEIHAGPTLTDYHCYPDCRPDYYNAFQAVANLATKQASEGAPPQIVTPLIQWDKTRVVQEGVRLNVPLHLTFSCYDPTPEGTHCEQCDACILRNEAL